MPNYEETYHTMMRAAEEALRMIIEAQRKCEEMYIEQENEEK